MGDGRWKVSVMGRQANVNLFVAEWNTKTLAKYRSAEHVDVTMRLVEAFEPNEKRKNATRSGHLW